MHVLILGGSVGAAGEDFTADVFFLCLRLSLSLSPFSLWLAVNGSITDWLMFAVGTSVAAREGSGMFLMCRLSTAT